MAHNALTRVHPVRRRWFRAGMDAEEAIEVIKAARPDLKRVVKVSEVSRC